MTLTATPTTTSPTTTSPPNSSSDSAFADLAESSRESWITTTDHRRLACLHLGFVLIALIATLVVGLFLRLEAADAGAELFDTGEGAIFEFIRFISAYGIFLPMLVIGPLWIALGTLVVPRQLGSARLAFPRLQALVTWSYIVGAGTLVAGFLAESGPPQAAWYGIPVQILPDGQSIAHKKGSDLVIASMMLLTVSAVLAAANFVVSVLTMRRPGQKIEHLRPFTVATFVTSAVTLLAGPVAIAGLFLVYLDIHFSSWLFQSTGGDLVWLHTVWFFGRPEAFLLLLPALGALGDIIVSRTGRPLFGGPIPSYLLVAYGALSLSVWAGRGYVANSVIVPTARWWMFGPAFAVALLALLWLASFREGVKADASLLFPLGVLACLVLGLVIAVAAAIDGVDGDTAVKDGFVATVIFGAPLIAGLGAVSHWSADAWGRRLNQGITALTALAAIGGVLLIGVGRLAAGLDGAPFVPDDGKWDGLGVLSFLGSALLLGAALLVVVNLSISVLARKGPLALGDVDGGAA